MYYIVREGTNERWTTKDHKPFVVSDKSVCYELKRIQSISDYGTTQINCDKAFWVAMTVEEYKNKFGDD